MFNLKYTDHCILISVIHDVFNLKYMDHLEFSTMFLLRFLILKMDYSILTSVINEMLNLMH